MRLLRVIGTLNDVGSGSSRALLSHVFEIPAAMRIGMHKQL